jgi:GNAT acetyltransferase-like protein
VLENRLRSEQRKRRYKQQIIQIAQFSHGRHRDEGSPPKQPDRWGADGPQWPRLLFETDPPLECRSMMVHQIDPIQDPRWEELVCKHPDASTFHSVAWLQALKRTYGYEPLAFTTSPPVGALKNGLVFCRVDSWLTGSRLVSLPFSDHCEPLCDSREDLNFLVRYLQTRLEHENWRYVEIRSISGKLEQTNDMNSPQHRTSYFLHVLDLRPELNDVFWSLDKDSVQRRIRRAERAGLTERLGRSEDLLRKFYSLFVATRRRQGVPPTPYTWFKNLVHCLGDAAEIRVAHYDSKPIAAILTLRFRNVLYYKYSCSDTRFKNLGATPWLLWNAIAAARATGAIAFDMGRTQEDQTRLLAFKSHWVSQPKRLVYSYFPSVSGLDSVAGWRLKIAKQIFSRMPDKVLALTGKIIYRHVG